MDHFVAGIFIGTILGVFVVGLCMAAGEHDRIQGYQPKDDPDGRGTPPRGGSNVRPGR